MQVEDHNQTCTTHIWDLIKLFSKLHPRESTHFESFLLEDTIQASTDPVWASCDSETCASPRWVRGFGGGGGELVTLTYDAHRCHLEVWKDVQTGEPARFIAQQMTASKENRCRKPLFGVLGTNNYFQSQMLKKQVGLSCERSFTHHQFCEERFILCRGIPSTV